MTALEKAWAALEGRRVESRRLYACVYCRGNTGVLRQHWCRDELELYCDRCERWTGQIITRDEVGAWIGGVGRKSKETAQIAFAGDV
jgi:hypothetical protein